MNVIIVGIDDDFVVGFSKTVAQTLGFEYVNFDTEFEKILIQTKDEYLQSFEPVLDAKERDCILTILKAEKQVISVCNNSFLSNKNYELFKDQLTIIVEKQEKEKILKNIQKLIKKHCKICLKQEKIDLNLLKNNIFKKLKNN